MVSFTNYFFGESTSGKYFITYQVYIQHLCTGVIFKYSRSIENGAPSPYIYGGVHHKCERRKYHFSVQGVPKNFSLHGSMS